MTRQAKWAWVAGSVIAFLALPVLALILLVNSESGTRWLVARAVAGIDGASVETVSGTLAGTLRISGLRFNQAESIRLTVDQAVVDLALPALLRGVVHVNSVQASGIALDLTSTDSQEEKEQSSFDLQPPIDLRIDRLVVEDVHVRRDGELALDATHAVFAGSWTDEGLAVNEFAVDAQAGYVRLEGRVAGEDSLRGQMDGEFRWKQNGRTFGGTLTVRTDREVVNANVQLSSPLTADLQLSLTQTDSLPWRLAVDAPSFDPRRALLPESSIEQLALQLQGEGTREQGTLRGAVAVNGETIDLDVLRFSLTKESVVLDTLEISLAESPGVLRASGNIAFAESPQASVEARWENVTLPRTLVGRELATHGTLRFDGGAEHFSVEGNLALGPPTRLANIVLRATGSAQMLEVTTLDIEQASGSLQANGRLQWQPALSWRANVRGKSFDPGELFPNWQGNLDLALTSNGSLAASETGSDMQVALTVDKLGGALRGRTVSGSGTLQFESPSALTGELVLRADRSTLAFKGAPGPQTDATVTLDIESLADWLPNSRGELQAQFSAAGSWPALTVKGEANGEELQLAGTTVESARLRIDATNPMQPEGSLQVAMEGLSAGGFDFATLTARLSGTEGDHTLNFAADGDRLDVSLEMQGNRTRESWSGSLQTLNLDLAESHTFALHAPATVSFAPSGFTLGELCLTEDDAELCMSGRTANRELSVAYRLRNIPLRLMDAFLPTLPMIARGTIDGDGDVRRSAEGAWRGDAALNSNSGQIFHSSATEEEYALLEYRDLRASVRLAGSQANVEVGARLDDSGSLTGKLDVTGLDTTGPVELSGNLDAILPNLSAVTLFVPQIAEVRGRAEVHATIAGTAAEPKFGGRLNASGVAAQLPALGIRLTNGEFTAEPDANGDIALSGTISSGEGNLAFSGAWTRQNVLRLDIDGSNFLAADLPSARVVIATDLEVVSRESRLDIDGSVEVTNTLVNVQKLPRGQRPPRASPDVVVVDEETEPDTPGGAASSLPIYAEVEVRLGENVNVEGYGINASVRGQIIVQEAPGQITRGSGELSVDGTYQAYGQDLTVNDGQVLYADAPLANPRLAITAVRVVDDVTAGLRITGRAQNPQVSVFSNPAMGEANALSYLVAGRPLNEIGTSESDTSMLESAARSLGTAGGGLLAKKFGGRLGVSEVGIEDEELIGGAAFTVGEYLSPRLFLSYGVGLFEPGEVVTLRYTLSDDWSVEAQRGSEETRAGVRYQQER